MNAVPQTPSLAEKISLSDVTPTVAKTTVTSHYAHHFETAEKDKVPFAQKCIYGMGAFANNLLGTASGSLMIALNLGLGMNPATIGLLGAIPRITDAMTDPIMGYISDHTKSKWGRRRPYILVGSIACGIIFSLLWAIPTEASANFQFWYYMIGSIIFYAAYTIWVTPWVALGYELSSDYHERTRVMGYSNFLGQFAYLLVPWFLWFMQLASMKTIMHGAAVLALLISLVVAICGTLSAIFLKEKSSLAPVASTLSCHNNTSQIIHSSWSKALVANMVDFCKGFWLAIKFRPFLKLCVTAFLIFNGFMMVASFSIYVLIYYVCKGDKDFGGTLSGWGGTVGAVCAFLIVIVVTKLGTCLGKKRAFYVTTSISIVGYVSKWWLFTPEHPWLSLIPGVLIAFGFGGLFPLVGSMIADVCDLDELQSHERREGMFGSIFWWVIKVGMAAALAIGGYLLNWTGFNVELASQSEATLYSMRILDIAVPACGSLIAIFVLSRFELTEEKAREVRLLLEQRKSNIKA